MEKYSINGVSLLKNEKAIFPMMGEFHFSRCPEPEWEEEIRKMRACGMDIIATYVFWIHHEEEEGVFDFTGQRNLHYFLELCEKWQMHVWLRIGPWAHGEARNGGFPDWLLKKGYKLRSDDPDYLALVERFWKKIYKEVEGTHYILGIQVENEYGHVGGLRGAVGEQHMRTLTKLAKMIGFEAPYWTATGWGGAVLGDLTPVMGGYCDAPWDASLKQLPPNKNYLFSTVRNDGNIGSDYAPGMELSFDKDAYPYLTAELGGGVQVTHHRRPRVAAEDIGAMSVCKLGSGCNLLGYYMYHGGTNKIGELSTFNETKATGYPNDYPILSYDFQAPLSEYGEVREQYGLLNMLHMFVNDFGEEFAPMIAVDSGNTVAADDTNSLRYGMRTNGKSGFVFVNHYQRLTELADIENAVISAENVEFPPIDVKGEVSFFMPFNMKMGDSVLECATAQPLCKCGETYFFAEIPNIKAKYKFSKGSANIVTVPFENAKYMRKLNGTVYIGGGCNLYEENGQIHSVEDGEYICQKWNGSEFETLKIGQSAKQSNVEITGVENAPFEPKYKVNVDGRYGFAEIDYVGDVAQIYADGELVADDYYYGKTWRVPCKLLYGKECYMVISEMKEDFYKEF